jgi:superfamily II DNA/RNA helicase
MKSNDWIEHLLGKLQIPALNAMQVAVLEELESNSALAVEAPTGSGKSLAFLAGTLPLIDPDKQILQGLILVPTRELAIQIETVVRQAGLGIKAHAFYGGYAGQEDRKRLAHMPSLLIGTPGRIASLIEREHLNLNHLSFLVIDEYDKMLEFGFESEMKFIRTSFQQELKRIILTSATSINEIPAYYSQVPFKKISFEKPENNGLTTWGLLIGEKDKNDCIVELLKQTGEQNVIVFCSYKEDIYGLMHLLYKADVHAVPFHGDMEQAAREESLIQFRTGSSRFLIASDLAARGLDIPALDLVIHYQLPISETSNTHRNGRTARMNTKGNCLYLARDKNEIPDFLNEVNWQYSLPESGHPFTKKTKPFEMTTLKITAGRQQKISKGDIVGFMTKMAGIPMNALGLITLGKKHAYIGIQESYVSNFMKKFKSARIKKTTVKIRPLS